MNARINSPRLDVRHRDAAPNFLGCLLSVEEFSQCLMELVRNLPPNRSHAVVVVQLLGAINVKERHGDVAHCALLNQVVGLWLPILQASDLMTRWDDRTFALLRERSQPEQALETARSLRSALKDFRFRWRQTDILIGLSVAPVLSADVESDVGDVLQRIDSVCQSSGRRTRHCLEVEAA